LAKVGELLKEIPKATPNPKVKNNESNTDVTLETKQEKGEKLGSVFFYLFVFLALN
jgi:hypothetical protein